MTDIPVDMSEAAIDHACRILPAGGAGANARELLRALRSALTAREQRIAELEEQLVTKADKALPTDFLGNPITPKGL
jgi:hypothetical protein